MVSLYTKTITTRLFRLPWPALGTDTLVEKGLFPAAMVNLDATAICFGEWHWVFCTTLALGFLISLNGNVAYIFNRVSVTLVTSPPPPKKHIYKQKYQVNSGAEEDNLQTQKRSQSLSLTLTMIVLWGGR